MIGQPTDHQPAGDPLDDDSGAPSAGPDALTFRRLGPADLPMLVAFLTAEPWPFHGVQQLGAAEVQRRAGLGEYWGEEIECYLVAEHGSTVHGDTVDGGTVRGDTVGYLRLFDLGDETALFDLRLTVSARGRGLGTAAVRWLSDRLFGTYAHLDRVEAHTLVGNGPMRGALLRNGFVQEGYHRQSWRQGETLLDSVSYALLRNDWAGGTVTPLPPGEQPWRDG
jgi:RimJ/RimL family protein N-acetyltransferase